MATTKVSSARDAAQIGALLATPEIAGLTTQLVATRWTGRPGYPSGRWSGWPWLRPCTASDLDAHRRSGP